MYLLDTNVVSALRRPAPHPAPAAWLTDQRPSDLYMSVVTIAEIERGVAGQTSQDSTFARELAAWLERTLAGFADRLLGIDVPTARRWGRLSANLGHSDADLLIAATALEHGLTVVTRNVRDFAPTGVTVLNPFGDSDD
jgi:predicted nucleic acid-binding protein